LAQLSERRLAPPVVEPLLAGLDALGDTLRVEVTGGGAPRGKKQGARPVET
jgi:hypothetical protein